MLKKVKAVICVISAIMFLTAVFSGCGTQSQSNATAAVDTKATEQAQATTEAGKPVTIKWWDWNPQQDPWRKNVIDKFQAKNPNIKIELTSYKDVQYHPALVTAIQGGEAPDIIAVRGAGEGQGFSDIIDMGAVEPLDGKVDVSTYDDKTVNIGKWKGKLYSIPSGQSDMLGIFFNRDIFAKAGITTIPKTIDDFEKMMDTLKKAGIQPFAFGGGHWVYDLFAWEIALDSSGDQTWINNFDNGKAKLADSNLKDILNMYVKWGKAGYYGDNYDAVSYDAAFLTFSSQKAAMVISGTWDVDTVKKQNPDINIGFMYFPSKDGKIYSNPMPTSFLAMGSKSQNKEVVANFLNFVMSVEGVQARYDVAGGVPIIKGVNTGDNPILKEIMTYDTSVLCAHGNVWPDITYAAKETGSPDKYLEAKSPLVFSGKMAPEEFIKGLDDLLDTGKLPRPILK